MLAPDPSFGVSRASCAMPTALTQATCPAQAYAPRESSKRSADPHGRTAREQRSLIAEAMRQLPSEHRAVIYRAYYQGWTTARIADDLKITEAAVKSLLHDGLHALRPTDGAKPN
jgi:DNA-directed RNA polymerase specialized sigma24 family protein